MYLGELDGQIADLQKRVDYHVEINEPDKAEAWAKVWRQLEAIKKIREGQEVDWSSLPQWGDPGFIYG